MNYRKNDHAGIIILIVAACVLTPLACLYLISIWDNLGFRALPPLYFEQLGGRMVFNEGYATSCAIAWLIATAILIVLLVLLSKLEKNAAKLDPDPLFEPFDENVTPGVMACSMNRLGIRSACGRPYVIQTIECAHLIARGALCLNVEDANLPPESTPHFKERSIRNFKLAPSNDISHLSENERRLLDAFCEKPNPSSTTSSPRPKHGTSIPNSFLTAIGDLTTEQNSTFERNHPLALVLKCLYPLYFAFSCFTMTLALFPDRSTHQDLVWLCFIAAIMLAAVLIFLVLISDLSKCPTDEAMRLAEKFRAVENSGAHWEQTLDEFKSVLDRIGADGFAEWLVVAFTARHSAALSCFSKHSLSSLEQEGLETELNIAVRSYEIANLAIEEALPNDPRARDVYDWTVSDLESSYQRCCHLSKQLEIKAK